MEEAAKQLALLPFWMALSAAERDMAARAAFLRRYDRGQPIYEGGSGCLGLVCVVSGGVRAYLLSEEGREVTLFRLAPGDVCVLSASCVIQQITFDLHIAAERACELLVLPAEAFERLEGSCEAVRSFVHARTAERFSAAMEAVQRLLFERFDRAAGRISAGRKRKKRRARGAYDARGACAAAQLGARGRRADAQALCGRGTRRAAARRGAADRSRAAARAGGVVRGRALTAEAVIGTRKKFFGHCDLVIVFAFVLRVY